MCSLRSNGNRATAPRDISRMRTELSDLKQETRAALAISASEVMNLHQEARRKASRIAELESKIAFHQQDHETKRRGSGADVGKKLVGMRSAMRSFGSLVAISEMGDVDENVTRRYSTGNNMVMSGIAENKHGSYVPRRKSVDYLLSAVMGGQNSREHTNDQQPKAHIPRRHSTADSLYTMRANEATKKPLSRNDHNVKGHMRRRHSMVDNPSRMADNNLHETMRNEEWDYGLPQSKLVCDHLSMVGGEEKQKVIANNAKPKVPIPRRHSTADNFDKIVDATWPTDSERQQQYQQTRRHTMDMGETAQSTFLPALHNSNPHCQREVKTRLRNSTLRHAELDRSFRAREDHIRDLQRRLAHAKNFRAMTNQVRHAKSKRLFDHWNQAKNHVSNLRHQKDGLQQETELIELAVANHEKRIIKLAQWKEHGDSDVSSSALVIQSQLDKSDKAVLRHQAQNLARTHTNVPKVLDIMRNNLSASRTKSFLYARKEAEIEVGVQIGTLKSMQRSADTKIMFFDQTRKNSVRSDLLMPRKVQTEITILNTYLEDVEMMVRCAEQSASQPSVQANQHDVRSAPSRSYLKEEQDKFRQRRRAEAVQSRLHCRDEKLAVMLDRIEEQEGTVKALRVCTGEARAKHQETRRVAESSLNNMQKQVNHLAHKVGLEGKLARALSDEVGSVTKRIDSLRTQVNELTRSRRVPPGPRTLIIGS